jgi:hypothetical protein
MRIALAADVHPIDRLIREAWQPYPKYDKATIKQPIGSSWHQAYDAKNQSPLVG